MRPIKNIMIFHWKLIIKQLLKKYKIQLVSYLYILYQDLNFTWDCFCFIFFPCYE